MNKEIEEMAIKELADGLDITMCGAEEIFTYIIKQGYQKVDKDKQVVLTKEEYDNLKLEIQKAHNKGVSIGFDLTKYKENSIEKTRKETAREILKEFLEEFVVYSCVGDYYTDTEINNKIQELAKQYGVEIKE